MTERCSPPRCERVIGHDGPCRPTWRGMAICGAPMRYGERCARREGHSTRGSGSGHRTAFALQTAREARRSMAA